MKIPEVFTPEKNLDKKIRELTLGKHVSNSYDEETVSILFEGCKMFLEERKYLEEKQDIRNPIAVYNLSEDMIKQLACTKYTKYDIEELAQRIDLTCPDEGYYSGFCLSALINKIITEKDVIVLKPSLALHGIGAHLKTGKIIVNGSVGNMSCYCMGGGEVIVEKNAGDDTGECMTGGRLLIKKNAGFNTGVFMDSGEIIVYGKIGSIAQTCKGKAYHKSKLDWSKIKFWSKTK